MRKKIKTLLTLISLSGALSGAAQRDVPFMWVPKGTDTTERNNFFIGGYPTATSSSKAEIINAIMGHGRSLPPAYIYSTAAIDTLLSWIHFDDSTNSPHGTGIRLHFASFDAAHVPTDFEMGPTIIDKQVILLFCGSTGNESPDLKKYYVISPLDMKPHRISDTIWNDWCNYYYSSEDNASGLVSTLESDNPTENQYNHGTYWDTRSIYYDWAHFTDFVDTERIYQDTCTACNPNPTKIDSIGFYFAAFDTTGIGCNRWSYSNSEFKDRMLVLIEFLRGKNIFFIDDALDFKSRPNGSPCVNQKFRKPNGGGNNGQLCPPNCPCPTCGT